MNNRERAMNLLHYKPVDRLPAVHFGYWKELLAEWVELGKIPREITEGYYDGGEQDRELDKLIGWDCNWATTRGANQSLFPRFEVKVLEELPDGSQRRQNADGLIERVKPGRTSIPSEDDYLLTYNILCSKRYVLSITQKTLGCDKKSSFKSWERLSNNWLQENVFQRKKMQGIPKKNSRQR